MANTEQEFDLEDVAVLDEAKHKAKHREKEDEDDEDDEGEECSKKSYKGKKMHEETLAASSLHPGAAPGEGMTKIGMMSAMMGKMHNMGKSDLLNFFNATMAQFGPGKNWGVGDNSAHNQSSVDMKPSHAVSATGPKTAYPMPKLNVKEDVEEMFNGQDLSEEFKENVSTLFEAAVSARLIAETARLEEEFDVKLQEEVEAFSEEVTSKLDTYLDYVVEQFMKENEVAVESTLRNELAEEFIDGLKNLFAEHYIDVPENKVDVLEAMAEKVAALEEKLDESITENVELKNLVLEGYRGEIFAELASDLALTQQEKFSALAEGIEFDGDLEVYANKLMVIKENYFNNEAHSYSSNIDEETFEGEVAETKFADPSVNRYVQAISRTVKK